MKGLTQIPSHEDLEKAYLQVQQRVHEITYEQWALWTQWARLDPRLAQLLVGGLANVWKTMSPWDLNQAQLQQPWSAALGPLLEAVKSMLSQSDLKLFRSWQHLALASVEKAPHEQYFIGLRSFSGRLMFDDVILSYQSYSRWGYFGREVLLPSHLMKKSETPSVGLREKTRISKKQRQEYLDHLLTQCQTITVAEYRVSLHNAVGLRQAELDLKNHSRLRSQGQTRYRIYKKIDR